MYPLTDLELASRLSFFLWSQGPDETLLKLAAAGRLQRARCAAGAGAAHARRPARVEPGAQLRDEVAGSRQARSRWCPIPNLFPTFNDAAAAATWPPRSSRSSPSVLLEDRNVVDLLTADHTFLNDRLARHYGITAVLGPQFRRVTLDDPRRWGLLGKGAVLLRTSYGDRTSPVLRGAWVLDKLMGTPPTPPPPDVDTDLSQAEGRGAEDGARAARKHRTKPGCKSAMA